MIDSGNLLAEADRLVLVIDDESEGATLESDAAAQNAALGDGGLIRFRIGRGIDQDGTFGGGQQIALANLVAEHGEFGQTGREEVPVAEAGGVAAAGDADFDVEVIAFLNAGRKKPRTRTSEVFPEARISLGLATFRLFISANSSARCGEGGGSEPVPASPVTSDTPSILTEVMP